MAAELKMTNDIKDPCLLCGTMPMTEDETPRPKPMCLAVGLDVNWGQRVFICQNCMGVMADFIERPDADKYAKAIRIAKQSQTKLEEVQGELETVNSQLDRIREGQRAIKEVKEGAVA